MARHWAGQVVERHLASSACSESGAGFVRKLVDGVTTRKEALDGVIERYAPEWPVSQLPAVDRNILRMALYEIAVLNTPLKVAINEAVELSKRFGSDSSPRLVNGVLGSAAAQRQEWTALVAVADEERAPSSGE